MSTSFLHASVSVAFYPRLYLYIACVFSILAVADSTSCLTPCDACPVCAHGTVKDACGCCECGLGPGAPCKRSYSPLGKCGDGLVCNILLGNFGRCIREVDEVNMTNPNSSNAENATTTTTITTPTTENATTAAITTPTTEKATTAAITTPTTEKATTAAITTPTTEKATTAAITTPTPATNPSTKDCRQRCSVDFCSDKARICSARGMEYSKVQARTPCQHTSCRACFLLVRANCTACPEPPNKKCLRRYHECVRPVGDVLLRLEDQRARSAEGQVFCYIPEVGTWLEPDSD